MEGEMSNITIDSIHEIQGQAPRMVSKLWVLALLLACTSGCSILHPVRGVPASYLPDEFEGARRGGKRTINPSLLVQTPPDQHRIAAGDVLSIYIPGVLGRKDAEVQSFGVEPPINQPFSSADPPTIGYPITVRDDHTIALPQIPPINVYNKTLHETELAIRKAYTEDFRILRPEEAMILVSLQRPRIHRVLVVRQETGNELASAAGTGGAGSINVGVSKRGTARVVTLNAYENDVLHALAMEEGVDGLPGLDAENTIYIIRRRSRTSPSPGTHMNMVPGHQARPQQQPPLIPGASGQQIQQMSGQVPPPYGNVRAAAYFTQPGMPRNHIQQAGHTFSNTQVPPQPMPPTLPNLQPGPATMSPPPYGSPYPSGGHNLAQPVQNGTMPYPPHQGQYLPPDQNLQYPYPPHTASPSPQGVEFPANEQWSTLLNDFDPTIDNPNVIRIPIRLADGEQPNISEEMIKLNDGDIVFIESRETDVFYTGGLLGGGQYTLPREYDLGVLEAISIAEGRSTSSGTTRSVGGVSALNRDVSVSASRVIILRTLQTGQRITVEVDLHKAMKYQEENIMVQPGDMLFLQYTAGEAIAAFTQRYLLEGALFSLAAAQLNTQ